MLSPLEKVQVREEFYRWSAEIKSREAIADYWLTLLEKAVEAERDRVWSFLRANASMYNTSIQAEFVAKEYENWKSLNNHPTSHD